MNWASKMLSHRTDIGKIALSVCASLLLVSALVLFIRILLAPVELGNPSTESEAVVRANERLLDMVKWTISTILTIGAALIGLNWYQSTQRYEQDKDALAQMKMANDERMQQYEKLVDQRLQTLQDASSQIEIQLLDRLATSVGTQIEERFRELYSTQNSDLGSDSENSHQLSTDRPQKGGWAAFWDNITSQQAGKRLTVESNKYLNPNPFQDMAQERSMALEAIESALVAANRAESNADDLIKLGATDIWKIIPLLAIESPLKSMEIESLLNGLGIPKPDSKDRP